MAKDNIPKGVRLEFDDVDYWHKLPKNKYVKLEDGSMISEYDYMKKFMHEYYGKGFDRQDDTKNILKTEEQKKEARRNNNNTNRDALLVSKKMGALNTLFQVEKGSFKEEVEDWENTFKTGTYDQALKHLVKDSCTEINIDFTKPNIRAILRIYFRISKFLKMVRRDKKTKDGQ